MDIRQYQGRQAEFQTARGRVAIPAFIHHLSDFTGAGQRSGFRLPDLKEWWHDEDANQPPRLVSFLFDKGA